MQIAYLNYPANEVLQAKYRQSKEGLKIAKLGYVQSLSFAYQFNISSLYQTQSQVVQAATPQSGLGAFINLGTVVTTPARVRQAREDIIIADANIKAQKLYIRLETLTRYQEYKLNIELLRLQMETSESMRASMLLMKKKFENGEEILSEYNKTVKDYADAEENRTNTQIAITKARASLEEIIGIPLDEVK